MMKKVSATVLFLFFILFTFNINAQKEGHFSGDTIKFPKELGAYFFEFAADKKEATQFILDFTPAWNSPDFPSSYKTIMIETCNQFVKKKLKPYPYFAAYINSVISFLGSTQPAENFSDWQKCVNKIMAGKSIRGFAEFLEISGNMFEGNMFYKSPTYTYKSQQGTFKFEYDTIPKIIFKDIIMVGQNPRKDSMYIEQTSGIFYPTFGKFYGKGGRVSWARAGLGDEVYADIKRYVIDCKSGNYTSDSAVFIGKQYFDKPQLGKITDRIITENSAESTYPRFDSYSKRLLVKNIYPDVDYDGGFGMRGPKFVGTGNSQNPAKIIFRRNNKPFLEVSARAFAMNKERVVANPGTIKFFLDKDSIYHQGLSFNYDVEKKRVTILRGDDGLQKAPVANSFHRFDMYFEQIVWNIEEPKINFGFLPNNQQGEAYFESMDFYTGDRASNLRGKESFNLTHKLNEFNEANGKQPFTVVDLAKYLKVMAVDLRPIIFKYAIYGLVYFEPETDLITVRQRLFDYMAHAKHTLDYDILTIYSVVPGQDNAVLNLLNYDLTIQGVKNVLLSDTQKVFIFPKNREIVLRKNRNIEFSGVVASGKFEFHGKDFVFDYEQFKIKMKTIDSIKIYVESFEPDVNGNIPFKKVQTVIENANGELRIDAPKNKSGWGKAPTFPQFQSFKESYSFYDSRTIFKGVYNRDKFYFRLDPFTMDSLDNFRSEGLVFDGEFVSAGIFPKFREKLTLQKDYSLGFIRQTPPGGFPIYGGVGNFDQEIRLSNKGLRGGGDFTFSASKSKVPDLIFFPDSANGIASTFDIKEQEVPDEFPVAHGDTVRLHFMPYKELLQSHNLKKPFKAYKEDAEFKGRFDLTKRVLTGNGKVDFGKADLTSGKILFIRRKFFSDTADFHLKAFDEEGFTFSTVNVNARIDFEKREGEFISNGEGSYVRFDKNQYIAYMDRFKWFMDSEDIELGDDQKKLDENVENALDLEGPQFISVHPKQDSLSFFAPAAKYNLRKYIIQCLNVPFINVADARIFPDSGKVIIRKNAVMDTLKRANILANTVTKHHRIRNVTANIFSKRNYLGSGEYLYMDENEKKYMIKFSVIKPDTSGTTTSEGVISEKDQFMFNDYFTFAGKVTLRAINPYLFFDGGTKIVHNCSRIRKAYLKFSGDINPKEILIPIDPDTKDMFGAPVVNAIMYALDTNAVYSGFLSPKSGRTDKKLISADGFLTFDKESGEYQISNKEKLVEQNLPGNYLSLNTTNCTMYGEGKFDLGADLGQVKLNSVGTATHVTTSDSAQINLLTTIDFFFDDKLLKTMARDLEIFINNLDPVDFGRPEYFKGLMEIMGKEKADKALADLNLFGSIKKFPDELEKTFFFNDVSFKYYPQIKSFISQGKLGLGNILKNEINRYVTGYIKIDKMRSGGDKLFIYIEADPTTWYYFEFYKGLMSVVSSNNEFNNTIKEMKPKSRKMEAEKGPSFQFNLCSPQKRTIFLNKMKQILGETDDESEENKEKDKE
ncbi:MAG: hypothetical protein JNK50_05820 [Bacteroidia bacterium]|nr:hypothetical protein [Bacteroidia bacterium]